MQQELRRSIGFWPLVFYGLGTMVGGGFYALLGKVAEESDLHAPLAFAVSGVLAALSALAFAELSARYPVNAGEARYTQEGFGSLTFGTVIGWLVVLTGVVSAATLSVATAGFLQDFVPVREAPTVVLLVLALAAIATWGVGQSVQVVTAITVIEVGALVYAGVVAGDSLAALPERWSEMARPSGGEAWIGIFAGGFLAFYAFIGFEDMVNIAEEVKGARRVLPAAILLCILLTTLIYVVVSTIAVLAVPPAELAASRTPIAELVRDRGWFSTTGVGIVSLLTGLNGALVQIMMASRVIHGMARRDQAPAWFARVFPKTQTPLRATLLVTILVLALALILPLTALARWTSAIMLAVFATVQLALWRIKGRTPASNDETGRPLFGARVPRFLSLVGFLACSSVLLFQLWRLLTE